MKKKFGNLTITYENDRFIDEVLINGEYGFLDYYPIVIDIGAHIGTFSFSMLDKADIIYAIEPVEENMNCLRQTIEDNNIKKIIPIQMAISYGSWVQKMQLDINGGGGSKLTESGDYPVDCRTLKDFMDSQKIEYADLIKMDVEGYEGKILNTPFFPKDRIGTIIGEFHVGVPEDVQGLLEYMGFKYINLPNRKFIARKK
ncbi:MAG: hypothetical protein A2163_07860 [Actinobacteria bacterium RBG_13_35_12]|nr:MAG: hypothetical protein A2163_07860 [Actinobacteria bacterium RBG_13_35_12]